MKNTIKKAMVATLLACALCAMFAACSDDKTENKIAPADFMSAIKSDAKLGEIVMLGAHDAGTVGQSNLSCTQNSYFATMLDGGVRYFDCRVTAVEGKLVFVHGDTNSVYLTSPNMQTLESACDAIVAFAAAHPSEVIVLDFQHTWDATEAQVVAMLEDKLGDIALDKELADVPSEVTLGQMREWGKSVVIVYRTPSYCADSSILYLREDFLQSEYDKTAHSIASANFDEKAPALLGTMEGYLANREDGKLFVLQSQITATGWLADAEAKFRPLANEWLRSLADEGNESKLAAINIVMRDFVCDDDIGSETAAIDTYKAVMELNRAKGLIGDEDWERVLGGIEA